MVQGVACGRPEHDLPALQWRWERHVRHHRHADKVMQRFTHFVPRARGQRLDARAQWAPGATEPGDTGAGQLQHASRTRPKQWATVPASRRRGTGGGGGRKAYYDRIPNYSLTYYTSTG